MKNKTTTLLIIAAAFLSGFAFKSVINKNETAETPLKRVTGVGGIFFKCKDPKKVREWYQTHLGLNMNPYGASFEWYEGFDSTKKAQTQWTAFPETTKYFEPSTKDFMINYRVANLEALVEQLKKEEVTILDKMEVYDYGKFIHIMDAEGNKIELWEAKD